MELHKLHFFIITFTAFLSTSCYEIRNQASGNQSHHLIVGTRNPGDRELMREYISQRSQWMRIVTVEKRINVTSYSIITQVAAYDQKTDGTGAYATIISGGPGFQSVQLRFKSQRGRGIDFVVELFGH